MIYKDELITPSDPFSQMPKIYDKDPYEFTYVYPFDSLQQQIPTFFPTDCILPLTEKELFPQLLFPVSGKAVSRQDLP